MVNHKHANDVREPGGSWVSLLVGIVIGTLIGGLGGALAMLLLAPQSGKKTRAKLKRQSRKLREQATDTMEDAVASTQAKARQVTRDVSDKAEELRQGG
jgi:gas vesicle protein